jgi:hypothetical protein
MKKIILILAISLFSCKCSPVSQTQTDLDKKTIDIRAENWVLRSQKDSLKTVIAVKDSLLEVCGCAHEAR